MRERENEIRNINRGMHQVNEIYKVRRPWTLARYLIVCPLCYTNSYLVRQRILRI